MNFFKKLKDKINSPSFKRVYSYNDLPRFSSGSLFWSVIEINDKESLEKIYKHISTANKIIYYCSRNAIECAVNTKKFGWCLLTIHYRSWTIEFGIWKSNTRYDIYNFSKNESLEKFINDFMEKARREYNNDKNL